MRSRVSRLLWLIVLLGLGCGSDRRRTTVRDSGLAVDATADATPLDAGGTRDGETPFDTGSPLLDSSPPPDTFVRDTGARDSSPRDTSPPMDARPPSPTIEDLQRGRAAEGAAVNVTSVTVTGVTGLGAWVQDPTLGPTYSGIRVYVGAAPGVSVGDRVDVSGVYTEYFGDSEIDAAIITRRGAGAPITPVSITVAQAGTEPYEGVLVRITDASSYLEPYDCTFDNPACTDFDLWQVSSSSASVVISGYIYQSADWLSRVGNLRVTGVASWRYDSRRIMPRTSADIAF